jgi:single-strand DNA-binding protein
MSLNNAILIGRVGQDAEITEVGSSTKAAFSLATSEAWKDRNGEKKEVTEWHNIEVWGKMAEAVGKWIRKGREVCVVGKITTQRWEGNDGQKKSKVVIRASELKFIGEAPKENAANDRPARRERYTPDPDPGNGDGFTDDDIPF